MGGWLVTSARRLVYPSKDEAGDKEEPSAEGTVCTRAKPLSWEPARDV